MRRTRCTWERPESFKRRSTAPPRDWSRFGNENRSLENAIASSSDSLAASRASNKPLLPVPRPLQEALERSQTLEALESENLSLEREIERLEAESASLRRELTPLEAEYQRRRWGREDTASLRARTERLTTGNSALASENRRLETEIESLQEELQSLEGELRSLEAESSRLEGECRSLENDWWKQRSVWEMHVRKLIG